MTLEEAIKGISVLVEQFRDAFQEETVIIANTATKNIQERIVETGIGGDGNKLKPYSTNYAKLRQAMGRPTIHRTLSFTNDMWNSVGLTVVDVKDTSVSVTVTGRDQFTRDKLKWNEKQSGKVLQPTKEEIKLLREQFQEAMEERITNLMTPYK